MSNPAELNVSIDKLLRMPADEVVQALQTNVSTGISEKEAQQRLSQYGSNVVETEEEEPLWMKFFEQFQDPMIILLLASAGVSFILGQWDDAISICLAVTIVVIVAFVQEWKSD